MCQGEGVVGSGPCSFGEGHVTSKLVFHNGGVVCEF